MKAGFTGGSAKAANADISLFAGVASRIPAPAWDGLGGGPQFGARKICLEPDSPQSTGSPWAAPRDWFREARETMDVSK